MDNIPFKDFVVSAIINIPLVTRHLLASVIYSCQFLPIKDNENTATSRASSANGTFFHITGCNLVETKIPPVSPLPPPRLVETKIALN